MAYLHRKERTGFEPAREENPLAGFRVRCRTELSHLSKMRRKGFEPSRPKGHMRLKHACLPFHHLRIVLLYSF